MTTIIEAKFDVEHRSAGVFVTVRVEGQGVTLEGEFKCETIGPEQIAELFRHLGDQWLKFSALRDERDADGWDALGVRAACVCGHKRAWHYDRESMGDHAGGCTAYCGCVAYEPKR